MTLMPGDAAPDFAVPDDTGAIRTLRDYAGKTLVLYFYPKDDTPGCTKEALAFRDLEAQFADQNAVIVGVSKDSVASHQRFKQKYALPFTLLSDTNGELVVAYGVWQEKNMYGKKTMGVVRTTTVIDPAGKVVRTFNKVKVDGHAEAVLSCVVG